jgi:hypothetical protein
MEIESQDQKSLQGLIVVVVFPGGKLAYTGEFCLKLGWFMD